MTANGSWMDTSEACKVLGISLKTLYRYKDAGKVKFTQLAGKKGKIRVWVPHLEL